MRGPCQSIAGIIITLRLTYFLYQLQRHSDHHAYPTRPFQALRNFDEAPAVITMLLPFNSIAG